MSFKKSNVIILGCAALATTNCDFKAVSKVQSDWVETTGNDSKYDHNDPKFMLPNANRKFASLPLQGALDGDKTPWSESYFANMLGGVARRWQNPGESPWEYASPTKEQLLKMSPADIRKLSAVEKFDIYNGRYDYPSLKNERARVKASDPGWEGLCNGWTAVSLAIREPNAVNVKNKDGIQIPFGSSDIKSLYMLNQDLALMRHHNSSAFIGDSCQFSKFDPGFKTDPKCQDVNAGAFHLAVTNLIGLQKKGFIADIEADIQIWNQPVFGYKSTVLERKNLPTGSRIKLETEMQYTSEAGSNFYPVVGTPSQLVKTEVYQYTIDLNTNGEIVGGEWISEVHPDFLWTEPLAGIEPEFGGIDVIYQESLRNGIESPNLNL